MTDEEAYESLTQRQREVIRAILNGDSSDRLIGAALGVSRRTVNRFMQGIFDKLGMDTRLELVLFVVDRPALWRMLTGDDLTRKQNGRKPGPQDGHGRATGIKPAGLQ